VQAKLPAGGLHGNVEAVIINDFNDSEDTDEEVEKGAKRSRGSNHHLKRLKHSSDEDVDNDLLEGGIADEKQKFDKVPPNVMASEDRPDELSEKANGEGADDNGHADAADEGNKKAVKSTDKRQQVVQVEPGVREAAQLQERCAVKKRMSKTIKPTRISKRVSNINTSFSC
jgi:hypothetical protein